MIPWIIILGYIFLVLTIFAIKSSELELESHDNSANARRMRNEWPASQLSRNKRAGIQRRYKDAHAGFIKPIHQGAVIMLVQRWKINRNRRCDFNSSMDMLEKNFRPHNPYPIILMETMPWKHDDIVTIRRQWKSLDIQFLNIRSVFVSTPRNLSINKFEDARSSLSNIHYKRMCHFFFCGFLDVPQLMQYRYLLRLDDDSCILDPINYDLFNEMGARGAVYGFREQFHDPSWVTKGLVEFARSYSKEHQLTWANERLHNASIAPAAPNYVLSFSSNFEVIDTLRYRKPDIVGFINAVDSSNMIFHRRWGDAPLRHLIARMFWSDSEVMHFCDFDYQHSAWERKTMCPIRSADNPVYYSDGKIMLTR